MGWHVIWHNFRERYANTNNLYVWKQVTFFLAEAPFADLVLCNNSGGLDDAKWFILADVPGLRMYDNMIPLLEKSIEILTKKS